MFQERDGRVRGYTGMTRAEIVAAFPGYRLPAEVDDGGWYDPKLGREPETRSYYRAIKVARAARERSDSDDVIALVSHAGFIDLLLKVLFEQLPARPYTMRYYHGNTAITRINFHRGWMTMHYMNRAEHLPADMRSF